MRGRCSVCFGIRSPPRAGDYRFLAYRFFGLILIVVTFVPPAGLRGRDELRVRVVSSVFLWM